MEAEIHLAIDTLDGGMGSPQPHDVVIEEPITILAEWGLMPDRIVGAEAHKPAEQQVAVELLEQQPFGADPVGRLRQ